jgi:hypothetical protein
MGAGGLQSTRDKPIPLLWKASLQSFQILDFARFCPEGVRQNARKNSKFKFSKISNWVDQNILAKDPKPIFVRSRDGVLLEG